MAAGVPRVATEQATGGERGSVESAMGAERLERVVRASRREAAAAARTGKSVQGRRDRKLVSPDRDHETAGNEPGRAGRRGAGCINEAVGGISRHEEGLERRAAREGRVYDKRPQISVRAR